MVFLEAERVRLDPNEGTVWRRRSTHPGDLPPGINALRLTRAVNRTLWSSHSVTPLLGWKYPFRLACPAHSIRHSGLDVLDRGQTDVQRPPLIDSHEVQEC